MTKRNPFRTLERAARIIGNILWGVLVVGSFAFMGTAFSVSFGWGWWGLLLIPAVPIALAALAIIAGLIRLLVETIHDGWLMARWRWDDRHPEAAETRE